MQYLIVDNDTDLICATITDLVNRYQDPKKAALEIVDEMNTNMLKAGDTASFRVEEAPDKISYLFPDTRESYGLEADTLEEAIATTEFLNTGLDENEYQVHTREFEPKLILLCNRK